MSLETHTPSEAGESACRVRRWSSSAWILNCVWSGSVYIYWQQDMCEFQESRVIIRQWRMFALLLILKLSQRVLLDVSAQTSRLLSCLMLVVEVFIISTREPFEKLISACSCMMSSVDWNQLLMATCECRPPACAFICKWHIFGTI